MDVEQLIDELDDIIQDSSSLPLSGGKRFVDGEAILDIIDQIRLNMPSEFRKAKNIIEERDMIIAQARNQGDSIIEAAKTRANQLVSKDEIVRAAQEKSNEILTRAAASSKEMRKAALDFVSNTLKEMETVSSSSIMDMRDLKKEIADDINDKFKLIEDTYAKKIAQIQQVKNNLSMQNQNK